MPKFIDLTGRRFHRWVVLRQGESLKPGCTKWFCRCDCGSEADVLASSLLGDRSKSCGCLRSELSGARVITDGMSRTPEKIAWYGMLKRCHNPKNKFYHYYGGRGIDVCERWRNSFQAFLEDMGPRPGPQYSIDRIDNEKGYAPENCRWATRTQQSRNTRVARVIEFGGKRMYLAEWAEVLGINPNTLRARLLRGWPPEMVLAPLLHPATRKRRDEVISACAERIMPAATSPNEGGKET